MSSITHSISPVNPKKRFEVIDIIRGFALFGVLVANMIWTSQHFAITDAHRETLPLAHINEWVSWAILTLIEFKFYTLFSMLFGLGFAMQLESAKYKNINILPVFKKRLFILLLIGIAHATLLWFGDILHVYALLGFLLILFRNADNSTLIKWIIGLALLSGFLPFLSWLASTASGPLNNPENYDLIKAMRFESLTSPHWIDVVHLNTHWNLEEYRNIELESDGTFYCLLASIAVFGLQILFSKWWLKRYQFGPFEWLWRSLTYGKLQPFKITN